MHPISTQGLIWTKLLHWRVQVTVLCARRNKIFVITVLVVAICYFCTYAIAWLATGIIYPILSPHFYHISNWCFLLCWFDRMWRICGDWNDVFHHMRIWILQHGNRCVCPSCKCCCVGIGWFTRSTEVQEMIRSMSTLHPATKIYFQWPTFEWRLIINDHTYMCIASARLCWIHKNIMININNTIHAQSNLGRISRVVSVSGCGMCRNILWYWTSTSRHYQPNFRCMVLTVDFITCVLSSTENARNISNLLRWFP